MAQYFAAQIVASLAYLRSKNIVHRDLKPANVVLNEENQIQLTDFGTAKNMISSSTSGTSDLSYVSGLSNISAISTMKKTGSTIESS
jgi:serine/threonine protein kinase